MGLKLDFTTKVKKLQEEKDKYEDKEKMFS